MLLDECAELPGGHPATAQVGGGRDGGGPRPLVDQRDLTEVIAGAERSHDLAGHRHRCLAVLDHEEADAAAALRSDRLALVEPALPHHLREALELLVSDSGEERHVPEAL